MKYLKCLSHYISRRFIQFIEDLAVRDADRYSDDLLVISAGQHLRSLRHGICKSFSEGCSSSSKPCNPETCERRASEPMEDTRSEIVDTTITRFTICSEIGNFLEKFCHKTLQGSSDDIGWLPRTPGMPGVEDGTARFLEMLAGIRNGEHTLPGSFVYLLIPACHIAKIHSEASVEHNAWELKQYTEELYWGSGKRVMLLGHSKGSVDAAAALSIYWCDLKDKVANLALIADKETRRIMKLLICKLIKGDIRALEDLTYEKRKEFIMKHKLPYEQIPLVSFHSKASVAPCIEYSRAATLFIK
ncbi:unnamed protein product [Prunus armeniaca]|uniref:Uncharacterized protein n=1 Tax=Prunus armeniaca TaxID=36596 RepID=A0A6J5Y1R8_PRUAR|nr:unnamed protein product [Prunus armeniaca]